MSWRSAAYRAVRPLLLATDAEAIHDATLRALALAGRTAGGSACRLASGVGRTDAGRSPVDLLGLRFRNRIGVGAGFDKDGVAIAGWAALGLGIVEVGTVTPRPQPGNPRPRLFRLPADEALINRMGFNNAGADALAQRLAAARPSLPDGFMVGVNIGCNADTPDDEAISDYVAAARVVASHADYLAVNVSSPNTPGLRDLQDPARLSELLDSLHAVSPRRPLLVKLAPDLEPAAFDLVSDALAASPAAGLILSNTTVARSGLRSAPRLGAQAGGLSGAPLRQHMLDTVRRVRERTGARFAIVASGGIGSAADAQAALEAGADLVQLWTGLVYRGPGLIGETVRAAR
ncbi:MAG: quinone-dependent dihydroorotate dehydrogenase [Candidatus Limnocylindria bacterium]